MAAAGSMASCVKGKVSCALMASSEQRCKYASRPTTNMYELERQWSTRANHGQIGTAALKHLSSHPCRNSEAGHHVAVYMAKSTRAFEMPLRG